MIMGLIWGFGCAVRVVVVLLGVLLASGVRGVAAPRP